MSASYDGTHLEEAGRDRARFLLGDTDTSQALLQDEEIDALLATFAFKEAVAQCCDHLVSRFAQRPDDYQDEGGVKVKWTERVKAWQGLAKRLRSGDVQTEASVPTGFSAVGNITAPDTSELKF